MDLRNSNRHASTGQHMRDRIRRSGVVPGGAKVWTDEEDNRLRKHFPDYPAMMKALPNRTRNAIRGRVQVIGIARKYRRWTGRDVLILRKLFPTASWDVILKELPGRTISEIRAYAQRKFLFRQRHYEPTGYPAIDAIRQRALQHNLSMHDLDELARTNGYFASARWTQSITPKYVFRAIEALDGDVMPVWRDH